MSKNQQTKRNRHKAANNSIRKFIGAVSGKNYAEANKYLKDAVTCKVLDRIDTAAQQPLFDNENN